MILRALRIRGRRKRVGLQYFLDLGISSERSVAVPVVDDKRFPSS